ncbi:ribosomal-processing cysteine protease Prp, partial [Staphylococcus aureus]
MIKVKFLKDRDNLIREIEVTGHADFDEYGK